MLRSKYLASFFISVICSSFVFLYIPFITYYYNVNEFVFDAPNLLRLLVVPFLSCFFILSGLFYISIKLLPKVEVPVLGRANIITPLHVISLVICLGLYIEGSFLNIGLPKLAGETGLFTSNKRLYADIAFWVLILVSSLVLWRKLSPKIGFLFCCLIIAEIGGISDAYLQKEPRIPITANRAEVLEGISFHERDNVLVFVLDAFPTYLMEEILERSPDLKEKLTGFLLFKNNTAPGGQTSWAIPAILQGQGYKGGDYLEFAQDAFRSSGSLVKRFGSQKHNIYVSSILPRFCALYNGETRAKQSYKLDKTLYLQLSFRFLPYYFKRRYEKTINDLILGITNSKKPSGYISDKQFYDEFLKMGLERISPLPSIHFHHIAGAHTPYHFDVNGDPLPESERSSEYGIRQQGEWNLRKLIYFFDLIKEKSFYDSSTIIIMADHGSRPKTIGNLSSFEGALFMIKPKESSAAFQYSNAPTSSVYMPEIAYRGHQQETTLADYLQKLPLVRYIMNFDGQSLMKVEGNSFDLVSISTVPINWKQKATALKKGILYTLDRNITSAQLAVPSFYDGVKLSGGLGIDYRPPGIGILKFATSVKKNRIDLVLNLRVSQLASDTHLRPLVLTITDLNSNDVIHQTPFQKPGLQTVTLKDLHIAEDKTIAIKMEADFPPETALFSLMSLTIE